MKLCVIAAGLTNHTLEYCFSNMPLKLLYALEHCHYEKLGVPVVRAPLEQSKKGRTLALLAMK